MNFTPLPLSLPAALVSCVAATALLWAQASQAVAHPEGFRGWRLVKSEYIGPDSKLYATRGGIHHFWANEPALEGYRTGRFPNGAILVEEILVAKEGEGDLKGMFGEGERRSLDVMVKNDALYKETGGWGFETFKSDNKTGSLTPNVQTQCYGCHSSQKSRDFVFSEIRQ